MTVPRRYRLAMRAYPARYRTSRGPELLATLADGDDDRGRPSNHEAFALAYRGLLERTRIAVSGEGLLVIAAVLVLFTMFARLTWAERLFLFRGEVAAMGTDGPGTWSGVALTISAFTILAAGPLHALESPRRRRIAAPNFASIYSNWQVSLPFAGTTSAGTWLALRVLSTVRPPARRPALAAGLLAAGAVALTAVWTRPDLPADYGRSAFADLGAAAFVTALSMLVALAACRRRGSNPY